jgi:hypothetical protein
MPEKNRISVDEFIQSEYIQLSATLHTLRNIFPFDPLESDSYYTNKAWQDYCIETQEFFEIEL